MRSPPVALALWVCLLGVSPAGQPADDMAALQGHWKTVELKQSGQSPPAASVQRFTLTVEGDRFTFKNGPKIGERTTFQLFPDRDPPQINMTPLQGPNKGKTYEGIYARDGNRLRLCWAPPGKTRPQTFESASGSGVFLLTLQREKAQ